MKNATVVSTATITNTIATLTTFTGLLWIAIICDLPFPLINCESSDENDQSQNFRSSPWYLEKPVRDSDPGDPAKPWLASQLTETGGQ